MARRQSVTAEKGLFEDGPAMRNMRVGLAGAQMTSSPAATRRANHPLVGRLVRKVQRHK